MKSEIFKIKKENQELKERIRQLESQLNLYKTTFDDMWNTITVKKEEKEKPNLKLMKQ